MTRAWRLAIDTGGTFTDCLAIAPTGETVRAKVLSSSALRGRVLAGAGAEWRLDGPWPALEALLVGYRFRLLAEPGEVRVVEAHGGDGVVRLDRPMPRSAAVGEACELASPEEAPVLAARLVTGTALGLPLPPMEMRLATTRGTNALLERRGAKTALFVTQGFGDLLTIGNQQRPDLFALEIRRPAPLVAAVIEVAERVSAAGEVLKPLEVERLREAAEGLRGEGVEAVAVVLMHAPKRPCHEQEVAAFLTGLGFPYVVRSAVVAARRGLLARAQTAVVDAYLGPIVRHYLERVGEALDAASTVRVMTSAGGLVAADRFRAKDSLLSGPAGGVVGAAAAGARSGFGRLIGFDMGGTSTDVSRYDGDFELRFEQQVGGAELLSPALAIETVAAGGGSICRFADGRLQVGPASAAASPGPACYGAGGPLTLTDVDLLLGRLDPAGFEIPISLVAAESAFAALTAEVAASGQELGRERLLSGLLAIADERMAEAIRTISVRRGYDPRDHALLAFGGAGGQHAVAVAELLGITTVLVPADAALLSAVGLAHAVVERFAERQLLAPLVELEARLGDELARLEAEAREQLAGEGIASAEVVVRRRTAHLRLAGQESHLAIELPAATTLRDVFRAAYRALYGYEPPARPIEVESLRVVASTRPEAAAATPAPASRRLVQPGERRKAWLGGCWNEVPVFRREELAPGDHFAGPALVFERHSATVVGPGWWAELDGAGALCLRREG